MWLLSGRLGNQMFQYAYLYAQARRGFIPDVYVQSPEHFEEFEDEIRTLYSAGIVPIDQVSIHVRRTDYVNNPLYVDLAQTPYYEKAMTEFPHASFLVFSDDMDWCKQQRLFAGCDFSEGHTDVEDFNLMAGCRGHVISNSSFSWWAAFVGGGDSVAPLLWYSDGVERTKCPPQWKRL